LVPAEWFAGRSRVVRVPDEGKDFTEGYLDDFSGQGKMP
jgi:hypothetical protein